MTRLPVFLSAAALVVSLTIGGANAAGIINGSSIKRGSIPADRLTPGAQAKFSKPGPRGPAGYDGAAGLNGAMGAPGVQGPSGINGPPGGFDPAKVSYATGADVAILSGQIGSATVLCPPNTIAVGGGGFNSITSLGASGPLAGGAGWYVVVDNESLITINVHAVAVCAAR